MDDDYVLEVPYSSYQLQVEVTKILTFIIEEREVVNDLSCSYCVISAIAINHLNGNHGQEDHGKHVCVDVIEGYVSSNCSNANNYVRKVSMQNQRVNYADYEVIKDFCSKDRVSY